MAVLHHMVQYIHSKIKTKHYLNICKVYTCDTKIRQLMLKTAVSNIILTGIAKAASLYKYMPKSFSIKFLEPVMLNPKMAFITG